MNYLDLSGEFSTRTSGAFVPTGTPENDCDKGEDLLLKVHSSSFSTNLSATEKAFVEMVESSDVLNVALDLTNVVHFHSRALRLLVDLQVGLERRGRALRLVGVSVLTERLFEYTRLDHFFRYERLSTGKTLSN